MLSSQSMANKEILALLKKTENLCEINKEYPSLKQSSIPRHLCTSTKPLKTPESMNIHKLLNKITSEEHEKDSNKQSKDNKEETEIIELFQYQQQEEINNKLYRKCRYQLTDSKNNNDDEERDNRN